MRNGRFEGGTGAKLTEATVIAAGEKLPEATATEICGTHLAHLLINFLGGERSLIVMMHGRPPVHHLFPLNYCLGKVDVSDPHTFLAIKRGILQYAWLKPLLGIATIVMKATNTYQEGYVGLRSGYFWSGIVYNISITLSLYSLAMFWVCMSQDLQSFRPMPKFLSIKLIIFASYWQGFFLSILVWIGAIPDDVTGYTPDNLAAAIQNALICFEMPAFAVGHWYAFSWHDYADPTISAARMPFVYAFRDAFGVRDLLEDTKETFGGKKYDYRLFDSTDDVLTHEESESRMARMMEGMRYERNGKGKYWIPKPGEANSRTPLLAPDRQTGGRILSPVRQPQGSNGDVSHTGHDLEPLVMDDDDERLYENARALEFGDWHYPVITAHEPSREAWTRQQPDLITPATNRHLLHPTQHNKRQRRKKAKQRLEEGRRSDSSSDEEDHRAISRVPVIGKLLGSRSSSPSSKSDRSQRVDLIVEDTVGEETERVRARKEGSAMWNVDEPRLYLRAAPGPDEGEEIREGFEPSEIPAAKIDDEGRSRDDSDTSNPENANNRHNHLGVDEERRAWGSDDDQHS
ncbi:MAG: hypothetical protein M1823_000968 [Watsoniomyces obsoletus]|nr:MAG: hypothetical protein M1823_000968 [Watsoniomyces obsoletus]